MNRKILILILSVILFFTLSLFYSINFELDEITIYQIIYISLFTVVAFSHSFIITIIDPALKKQIKRRFLLLLSRSIILLLVGVFIYLFEYAINHILQDRVSSLGLLLMLIPTITVFVGIVLCSEKTNSDR